MCRGGEDTPPVRRQNGTCRRHGLRQEGRVRSLGDDAGGGGIVDGVVVVWVAVWRMVGSILASNGARCGGCVVVVV
ncbi:hypothetical protein Pmani_012810 [Petrolisthes manimaculis]|uniref:Uncharacterized protein n=1 Tax=Petrolisthes manimaculis TaxID=1843537 RepID=A0AAE1UE98_9EUCA|nr:hypothetical protein Pmani_012810 [Petrolisthes manimaculis]